MGLYTQLGLIELKNAEINLGVIRYESLHPASAWFRMCPSHIFYLDEGLRKMPVGDAVDASR